MIPSARQLARIITDHRHEQLETHQAIVQSVDYTNKVATIRIAGSTSDSKARYLSYTPSTNDTVIVLSEKKDTLILGKLGEPSVPVGTISMFGSLTAPAGWLLCDGRLTTGYPALAAVVGVVVPDLRDRFVLGAGAGWIPPQTGGTAHGHHHGLGTLDDTAEGSHLHISGSGNDIVTAGQGGGNAGIVIGGDSYRTQTTNYSGLHNHSFTGRVGNQSGADGDAQLANMPPFLALAFIIKY